MINSISDTVVLNNGVEMPRFGLGVYKAEDGNEVTNAVRSAIHAGYRSIDTASFYKNEKGVGEGIRTADVSRDELFITTKVWNDEQGYDETLKAFQQSREKLGVSYLDLYLIHWPIRGKFKDTWRALEKLYKEGYVRAIGVSNFKPHHLHELLADSEFVPAVNQVEFHPRLTQEDTRAFCYDHRIQMEAWSPMMRGRLFDHPAITSLAEKYQKTPAQIILRWDLQHDFVTIPKSVHEERIRQNANVFDFELDKGDMDRIDALNTNERIGPDPDKMGQ
ncbi:diketogulonate reductase-like aldo/keto reductase [Scopulibacillus darangshiensis]|uniref:Diketogulonate reductase-like aldo/keto reductase n=1 Tax=Scopulibacillus darangshiensis TaxID=442528 RepID=A0A4R2NHR7_9BACL|nr:aldo/keto reductase [Scopulibacillus darangshiensis]TCP20973.1 diketogulonate reductase-like aldo/keto reductase [Scopulibacillus darangshiensis]